jgi:hypothetical protein
MQDTLNKIFDYLKDYENFESYMLNIDGSVNEKLLHQHIKQWINQFESFEQEFIASIVIKLLENRYITKKEEAEFINELFENQLLKISDTMPRPLQIQGNGKSQKHLVQHYQKVFSEHPKITYSQDSVIYLDDFIFSGGRIYQDLTNWIPCQEKSHKIYVGVIGCHSSTWKTKKELKNKIFDNNQKNNLNSSLTFLDCDELENKLSKRNESDVLWPMRKIFQTEEYKKYEVPNFKYRDGFIETSYNLFKNNDERVRFENICLKYGFKIIEKCKATHSTTKPLGNCRFNGYGFGGLVFNYRNCPNNTPLIFWWGSGDINKPHLYNQWHPLMPRTVY